MRRPALHQYVADDHRNEFSDWVTVGEGLLAGREWAMQRAGVATPYGARYNRTINEWLDNHPWARDPQLKHPTSANAVWLVDNLAAIEAWRAADPENKRYNHPSTIRKEITKAQHPTGGGGRPHARGAPGGNRSRIADLQVQLKAAQDMADGLRVAFDQAMADNAALHQEIAELNAKSSGLVGYAKYPLLGLDPPFTADTVRRRHRQAAKGYHPDQGGSDQQMQLLNGERDKALKEAAQPGGAGVSVKP
jgi:hypothetical protein